MALSSGARLGSYEIVALIGAGGMGEVYRARDSRLKRDVAIKVLPDAFANDAGRLTRFQREAELLATLNHPNIGAVYGFEQSQSASAIVLELIDGETLADRLSRGPIPIKEALQIARLVSRFSITLGEGEQFTNLIVSSSRYRRTAARSSTLRIRGCSCGPYPNIGQNRLPTIKPCQALR